MACCTIGNKDEDGDIAFGLRREEGQPHTAASSLQSPLVFMKSPSGGSVNRLNVALYNSGGSPRHFYFTMGKPYGSCANLLYCTGVVRNRDNRGPAAEQFFHSFLAETLLAHKSLFDRVGKFDPRFSTAEDVDVFARANDLGAHGYVIRKVLVHKCVHDSNISLLSQENDRNLPSLLRESIHRKQGK